MEAGAAGLVFVARSESRAARLHRAALALAPEAASVLLLPGWDCLPYDRASPSATVMGRRMANAAALAQRSAQGAGPLLLVASVEAAMQRLPRPDPGATLRLARGDSLDPEALRLRLGRLGYRFDERVDEPGEAAIHNGIVDLFPAWAPGQPAWRIRHEDGRIAAIHRYDAASQRSQEDEEEGEITLGPASELLLPEDDPLALARPPGLEHALPAYHKDLLACFDLLPHAPVFLDETAEAVRRQRVAEVAEAFQTRLTLRAPNPDAPPLLPPDALHLDDAAWAAALGGRRPEVVQAPPEGAIEIPPRFATMEDPEEAFLAYAEEQLDQGRRLALAGGQGRGARRLLARLGVEARKVDGWPGLLRAPPGSVALLKAAPGPAGFATAEAVVVPFPSIRPGTAAATDGAAQDGINALTEAMLQPGDAVIHMDHGLGALRGVEAVDTGEARQDCLRLDYAAKTGLLVPFDELDRLWRYGAEAPSITLDRLDGDSWAKRRAEAEAEAERTAHRLLELVREREAAAAPVLRPPREPFERLCARFPFDLTPDQASAIEASLNDLASGRPMDRLLCGDVGFGKTEVALRAAAAAALAGRQVALLAPTTVLVRQHLETFRRRFAGLPVRVEALSRLTPAAKAREVRKAIAAGEVGIAIGTQALAAKTVRFRDLALLIIDEEQRFGIRQKQALQRMREGGGMHVLTLTATPIPRTLQTALIGLRDLSVIATPPARRQPVRTLRAPMDDALLAQALGREARRGGQSFIVCPRIEDIAPMRERIAALAPELSLIEAHGGLPPAEMDEAVVRFAAGEGDVLLSTNIVEAGLDVPRANTMLVWHPDRFGLAQLHQLRGRVGRGRVRGVIYLLTDPAAPLPQATERRLRALEAMDRIGAGFAISARDLDLRGAGDLLGEAQAGHLRLVGIELYRHLLDRALAVARGKPPPEAWSPSLAIGGVDAFVPSEHVPDEALRVDLLARLGRILRAGDAGAVEALGDELEDRFGPAPEPLRNLLALACLSARCRRLGIARLEAGPKAAAATPRGAAPAAAPPVEQRDGRLILSRPSVTPEERLAAAEALLAALRPPGRGAASG